MKKALIISAALGALLLLVACDAKSVRTETDPTKTTYSRDARTDLCFATIGRAKGGNITGIASSFSVTNVPCSEAVLSLVPAEQGGTLK